MANICCCKYVFFTKDESKDELLRLHRNLTTIIQPPEVKIDSEPGWLGHVAVWHNIDGENVSCRGTIEKLDDYEPDTNFFTLYSDTDWCPMDELLEAVVAQYIGVSFVYLAEEPGFDIFTNTDETGVYIPEKYLLEIYGNARIPEGWFPHRDKPECFEIREYFSCLASFTDYCAKLTGKEFSRLEELRNYFATTFYGADNTSVSIREFTAT